MVALVLVSHSAALAESVRELALQMAPECTILVAAGIDDPVCPIGTDAVRIMDTLAAADNPHGTVVLLDLGSAILSTQTALDLLAPEQAARVSIAAAPLVEGAIAAAISAAAGESRATVVADACAALAPKQQALGGEAPVALPAANNAAADGWQSHSITVANPHGLHARPAAKLVAALKPYRAELQLHYQDKIANPRKMNDIAALGVRAGDTLTLRAHGEDAAAALHAFAELAASHFGEI